MCNMRSSRVLAPPNPTHQNSDEWQRLMAIGYPQLVLDFFPLFYDVLSIFFCCKGGCLVTVYGAMMRPVLERAWENCETAIAEGGGTPVGDVLNIS